MYLLTAGTRGSFLLRGRGSWVSPAHFGSADGEGCSWAPAPILSPFGREGGRENWGRGITSVPAGRTSCAWPLPAGPRSLLLPLRRCTPSHARMYLLARPPGVFSVWLTLYLMLPISGDGDKSKDVWVSLRRKDKIRYSAVVWRKSEGREDESWFCRVP